MRTQGYIGSLLALFLCVAGLAPAAAAPVSATIAPPASAALLHPLTLLKLQDLSFGNLGVVTGGTATINPVSGAITTTGGVTFLGGTMHPARFAGSTQSSAVVNIRIPNRNVLITRVGGTEKLTVSAFTLDGQSKRTMAQAGVFEFNVGATVTVPAGAVEGTYTGTFDVTIQYP